MQRNDLLVVSRRDVRTRTQPSVMRTAWASAGNCKALSMAAVDDDADESMRWLARRRPLASSATRRSSARDNDDAIAAADAAAAG
jgi:hypothetical protein